MSTDASLRFVNLHYWPDHAATGQHLTDLAEDLEACGWSVEVLCGRGRYESGTLEAPSREGRRGVRIRRLRTAGRGRGDLFGRFLDYASFYLQALGVALFTRRRDLVVYLTTPSLIAFVGAIARVLRGQSYGVWSMDLHPQVEEALGIFPPGSLMSRGLRAMRRAALRRADFVVALGGFMAERLRAEGVPAERLHVIPVWSSGEEVRPVPAGANPLRARLGLEDAFVVMYSGNAGLGHRFGEVLEAAGRLEANGNGGPPVELVFVGGGPRKEEILAEARRRGLRRFRYLEYFPREDLSRSLALGDVHLLTLREEMAGLIVPSKLYGIMAAGRPTLVVGPTESEPAEAVAGERIGELIDPSSDVDPAGRVVAAIERYRDDPEVRRADGERARRLFERRYERSVACGTWEELLAGRVRAGRRAQRDGRAAGSVPKRALDVGLSLFQILLSAPLWALIPLAIKLEDGGPVFFGQRRIGRDGRPFTSWKFRSMTPLTDAGGASLRAELERERITRVGRVLRATALDELPQLWNILRGDMSYVGPRALVPAETEAPGEAGPVRLRDLPGFEERHSVRPGLTGLTQVRAPRDIPTRHKFRYDLLYVRRRSLWLDLKLIARSVWISLRGAWPEVGREES